MTPGLVDQVYGTKVSAALLDGPGGYAHPDGHPGYWTSSTRELLSPGATDNPAQEFAYARAHFFRPLRLRDPFHTAATSTESFTVLDAHDLLVAETRDALGNTTRAVGLDYRVLRPSRLADPNGNISAVAYDPFGVVAGSAVMGKPAPAPVEGDTLDGFVADPTPAQLQDLLADPRGPLAATLLAGATTRTIVDRNAFRRTPAGPPVTVTIVREIHVSDLPAGAASPLQVRLAYSDGLGRQVQTKVQARAGPVAQRDAAGAVIVGADGQPVLTATDADPRWIASGWTVYNNKGFAVRQYQPFYTDRHQFEFDVRVGSAPSRSTTRWAARSGCCIPTTPGRRPSSARGARNPGTPTTRWRWWAPPTTTSVVSSNACPRRRTSRPGPRCAPIPRWRPGAGRTPTNGLRSVAPPSRRWCTLRHRRWRIVIRSGARS
ncbi:hypothetical protein NIIDMKKI_51760 [Mycobacterium kansasii]|uniref:Uncharacterized protein n=1 Tax=Mycobacterium kansasii TaxID=1768 RepID=A0A7G1IGL3_MYCKA|nr:hypothetical protein NIIDMKKI_51760 [Mycobacterium kansasii]